MSHGSSEACEVLNRTRYSDSNLQHTHAHSAHLLPEGPISQRTKKYTRRPFLEIAARHQRPDKQKTQKFHEEKCSALLKHEMPESGWRAGLLSVLGGHLISSQDRAPAPEGARPALFTGQVDARRLGTASSPLSSPPVTAYFHATRTGMNSISGWQSRVRHEPAFTRPGCSQQRPASDAAPLRAACQPWWWKPPRCFAAEMH